MSPLLPPTSAASQTSALGKTAGKTEQDKLHETAQQFEALFLRQMLGAARKTDFGSGSDEGAVFGTDPGTDTFRQMQDDNFADITAKSGTLGFASLIEAQMARFLPADTANSAGDADKGAPPSPNPTDTKG
ncbi:rod-binding protein [Novosphingobium sp. 9]|uniref:rod-binding protein n=1 Tax=Novosphingobium sp. 9 TaxID=2025349 RepID=UPI0021B4D769|nr:rod-binding protein [Novosphingobium sp. 9]